MTFYSTPLKQGDYEDIADLPTSTGEYVAQKFSAGFDTIRSIAEGEETANADYPAYMNDPSWIRAHGVMSLPPVQTIPIDEARKRVKDAGLDRDITNLGSAPDVSEKALDIMMRHAQERRYRAAQIERGPSGFVPGALGVGAEFFGNALDPVNMAAFALPPIGEVRRL